MPTPKRNTRATTQSVANVTDFEQLVIGLKNEIFTKIETEMSSVKGILNSLTLKVTNLETKLTSLQIKYDQHDDQIKQLGSTLDSLGNHFPSMMVEEVMKRVQRQNNLIISGIPEPSSGKVEERINHDQEVFAQILNEVGVEHHEHTFQMVRIGKPRSDHSRLLKIECQTMKMKNEISRKAKSLRKSKVFRNVYINDDRTPTQQAEMRLLRQKLQERKDQGDDVVIFRNKVVLRDEVKGFLKEF